MSLDTAPETNRKTKRARETATPSTPGETLAPPPKLRRRPILIAGSVAAICLGALLAVWAYTSTSSAQEVLAVRNTVHRGELITRDDLMTAQVGVDPALRPMSAADLDSVVGKRAAMDLAAGGLVTQEDLATAVLPAKGMSIVGISLTSAMMPATELQTGDDVRIVSTPGDQGDVAAGEPVAITATVVEVRTSGDSGQTVVDVSVPETQAAQLAARAATGKVALVLDSRER